MKNRTDFVRVGWKEQLWQAVCNQMEAAKAVLWVLFGFVSRVQVDVVRRIKKYQGKNCWNLPKKGLQNQPSFWQRHIYH